MDERTNDGTKSNVERLSPDTELSAGTDEGWIYESQGHYDPAEPRDLTTVIINVVAHAEGVSIRDIKSPPLHDVVDASGIESALFGRSQIAIDGMSSSIEFPYRDHKVRVDNDGYVTVFRRTDC